VPVWTDAQRLQQVLANLISNAIKFSPANATVQVSVTRATDRVRLTVKDQGPGIPAEFRTRIFQKFSQADSSDTRQKGGTGLGLAISRDLVERMGGRIGFESVEGQGASFWIELPLAPDGSNAVAGPYCLF
jgi:signal transduction histidine kinase